jgi:hypothetical protein
MQKNRGSAIDWPRFGVPHIQEPGINLLHRGEGQIRSRLDDGQFRKLCGAGLHYSGRTELSGGDRHGGSAKGASAITVHLVHAFIFSNGRSLGQQAGVVGHSHYGYP